MQGLTENMCGQFTVFSTLPADLQKNAAELIEILEFKFGDLIVTKGKRQSGLYMILSGRVRVVDKGDDGRELCLAVLGAGETFGEMSLLSGGSCVADVRASSRVKVGRINADDFDTLAKNCPGFLEYFTLQSRRRTASNFIKSITDFGVLEEDCIKEMISILEPLRIEDGETVVRQGDQAGSMYLVADGKLKVLHEESGEVKCIGYLRTGDYFGERSLLKNVERAATVVAETAAELLTLTPQGFKALTSRHPLILEQISKKIDTYSFDAKAREPLDFIEMNSKEADGIFKEREPASSESNLNNKPHSFWKRVFCGFLEEDKFSMVYQTTSLDCGAACLAMIAESLGCEAGLAAVKETLGKSATFAGTSTLLSGAQRLGLEAKALKLSKEKLFKTPEPFIAHWQDNHWIVVYAVNPRRVIAADPALGIIEYKTKEFLEKWSGYSIVFKSQAESFVQSSRRKNYAFVWRMFNPELLTGSILCVVKTLLLLTLCWRVPLEVFKILTAGSLSALDPLFGILIGAAAVYFLLEYSIKSVKTRAGEKSEAKAATYIVERILKAPLEYVAYRSLTDGNGIFDALRELKEFCFNTLLYLPALLLQALTALALVFWLHNGLGFVLLLTVPACYLVIHMADKERLGFLTTEMISALFSGAKSAKISGREMEYRGAVEVLVREKSPRRQNFLPTGFELLLLTGGITTAAVICLGARDVISGSLSTGEFTALVLLTFMTILSFSSLAKAAADSKALAPALEILRELEEQRKETETKDGPREFSEVFEGSVEVRSLTIVEGGKTLISELSFSIEPGEILAVVGRNPEETTALLHCLSGRLDPDEGMVKFDQVNTGDLNPSFLRRAVSLIDGNTPVFEMTLVNNITFGKINFDKKRLYAALERSGLDEFATSLPFGLNTVIREGDVRLKPELKIRLAFARVMYFDNPVVALDRIDGLCPGFLRAGRADELFRLGGGRTLIVVPDEVKFAKSADRIIVLSNGRIVEEGNHQALMKTGGIYWYLWNAQIHRQRTTHI